MTRTAADFDLADVMTACNLIADLDTATYAKGLAEIGRRTWVDGQGIYDKADREWRAAIQACVAHVALDLADAAEVAGISQEQARQIVEETRP